MGREQTDNLDIGGGHPTGGRKECWPRGGGSPFCFSSPGLPILTIRIMVLTLHLSVLHLAW